MIEIDIKKQLHGSIGDFDLDINLNIKQGDFTTLIGKSGSGKTTLLRILAGLEKSNGSIEVDNKIWQDEKNFLEVQKRQIGFVFQDFALFENMSVEKNLLYVNKDRNLANKLLDMTELSTLKNRMPNTLSGGQKQRVSLCRALMNKPKLLLMDEPLSALDSEIRNTLQEKILELHREFNTTTIMVSHDLNEIYKLADYIVELENGKIINQGNKSEVLLKQKDTNKFNLEATLLDILKEDEKYIAVSSIGNRIIEIYISANEAEQLKIGQKISINTKNFSAII